VGCGLTLPAIDVRSYDAGLDGDALRALVVDHQDFHRALEAWPEGKAIVDVYVAFLETECARHDGRILVAALGGEVIGFICVVASTRNDSPDDPAPFAWVHDVFVRPDRRGQGVGRSLLAAAETFARGQGAQTLRLGELDRNARARALYRVLGFRDYTRVLTKALS